MRKSVNEKKLASTHIRIGTLTISLQLFVKALNYEPRTLNQIKGGENGSTEYKINEK